jgi:putative DNA primase/helicase
MSVKATSDSGTNRTITDSWPEPTTLQRDLPAVQRFDENLLPESLRPYCLDAAERMEVPPDFTAIPTVVALSGAVARRVQIQPRAIDDTWKVTPNLWGGIVALSGRMKSASIEVGLRPLRTVEREWARQHAAALAEYNKAPKDERGDEPPKLKRVLANDATYEALHELHADNPAGILVCRDELTGWLAQLDQKGREGERAFYLTGSEGHLPYTVDRISRGSIPLPACCLCVLGGLQPQKLSTYLVGSLGKPQNNDGLTQRLQLLVYPDFCEDYNYVDRLPNRDAAEIVDCIFSELAEGDPDNPMLLRFSPEAQDAIVSWHLPFERMVRSGKLHDVLTSHFAKFKSLVPSLALLFELADSIFYGRKLESVSYESTERAIAWAPYIVSHAQRIYAPVLQNDRERAIKLAEKLKCGRLTSPFTVRDVYSKNWELLNTSDVVHQAATYLVQAGWLREERVGTTEKGGRPSIVYHVNPRLRFEEHLRA